jgi:hypothetical protein
LDKFTVLWEKNSVNVYCYLYTINNGSEKPLGSPFRIKYSYQHFIPKQLIYILLAEGDIIGKAIPLQALTGPEGSRKLRLPDFKTIRIERWQGCQPYAPAAFMPRKYFWYSFLLEAESTPGP